MLASTEPAALAAAPLRPVKDRLVVIGNGPSLRGFDFAALDGVDSLGMNAAYRHWDRIDWRPTHYACLDDALIDTHHGEIRRLMDEGRIRTAFLSGRFLDHHPDLAGDPRYCFLDQFVLFWHETRGAGYGLAFDDNPFFRSADPGMLTTGAYSVRYGAWLGYREISIIGVDLVYEDLPQAKKLEGNRLRFTDAPKKNPNYFFDDYQRPGDEYHIPNPEEHDCDLHVQSFKTLRDDFVREGIATAIYNANPHSVLASAAILPFRPLAQAIGASPLSAVIVPVTVSERQQVLDNIWLWSHPAFFPFLGRIPSPAPVLVFVFNNDEAAAMRDDIVRAFDETAVLQRCFSELRFENLALAGDADLYERDDTRKSGAEGRRAGPNNMFFGGLAAVADLPGHALWMEADCTPVRANWLARAGELAAGGEEAWVIGSIYRGDEPLGAREKRHINGNAIYAAGSKEFQAFVDDVWKPQLRRLVRTRPELAFDCVIEALYEAADSLRPADRIWRALQRASHRFRYADFIQNIIDAAPSLTGKAELYERILAECPDTYLVHSRRLAGMVSRLRRSGGAVEPTSFPILMRGDTLPEQPAGSTSPPVGGPQPTGHPVAGEPARPQRRATLAGFGRWTARLVWARRLLLAPALLAAAVAAITAAALAPHFIPVLIVAGAVLAVAGLAVLAFTYLSVSLAGEAGLAESRDHELKAYVDWEVSVLEARLNRRVAALERRNGGRG